MKIEYMLAFLGGVELMALANALSLGLLPCRFLALIFLLVAFVGAAISICKALSARLCLGTSHATSTWRNP